MNLQHLNLDKTQQAVIDLFDDGDELLIRLKDCANQGCVSGLGLIYNHEIYAFYAEHKANIESWLEESADSFDMSLGEFIDMMHKNVFKTKCSNFDGLMVIAVWGYIEDTCSWVVEQLEEAA